MDDQDRELLERIEEHIKEDLAELKEDLRRLDETIRGNGRGLCARVDGISIQVKWLWGIFSAIIIAAMVAWFGDSS